MLHLNVLLASVYFLNPIIKSGQDLMIKISIGLPVSPPTSLLIPIFQFQRITKKKKMQQKIIIRNLYCFQCFLQFDGKSVHDLWKIWRFRDKNGNKIRDV